jgi:hypothetical protein
MNDSSEQQPLFKNADQQEQAYASEQASNAALTDQEGAGGSVVDQPVSAILPPNTSALNTPVPLGDVPTASNDMDDTETGRGNP